MFLTVAYQVQCCLIQGGRRVQTSQKRKVQLSLALGHDNFFKFNLVTTFFLLIKIGHNKYSLHAMYV